MTSLTMLASLIVFVAVTTFAYNRYESSMVTAVLLGFMGSVLTGGSMQPGFFAEPGAFNFLGVAVILAPIFAFELQDRASVASGNSVLLSRESYAGLNLRSAAPVAAERMNDVRRAA